MGIIVILGPRTDSAFEVCPVCSVANKMCVSHTGAVCKDGAPAFNPQTTPEYQVFCDDVVRTLKEGPHQVEENNK